MLIVNKMLQKAEESILIWFSRVSYSQSGALLALLIEKTDTVELFKMCINALIQAAKIVDIAMIRVETLEH